ncbi:uncharacterized protein LOC144954023 [Lampetra fluviatilis]
MERQKLLARFAELKDHEAGGGEGQAASVQPVLEHNRSLHEANVQLSRELQVPVDHTAHLQEKLMVSEMERQKLLARFAELKDHEAGGGEGQAASVQPVLEHNRSLHEANAQLSRELQVAVDHTAHLQEKLMVSEMERQKLLARFAELKDHEACRLDIMSLVDTQTDEGGLRQQLQLLLSLQELINELEPRTVLVSELEEALRPSEELGPQIASLETKIGLR